MRPPHLRPGPPPLGRAHRPLGGRRRHRRGRGPHRLHRRIFRWFGAAILITLLATRAVLALVAPEGPEQHREDVERLAATAFALVWDDPDARAELGEEAARRLHVGLRLQDARGAELARFGPLCEDDGGEVAVARGGTRLGSLRACFTGARAAWAPTVILTLLVVFALLWSLSLMVARHLTRPLRHVAAVAERIGRGELGARVVERPPGELGALAERIDAMAERIERQLSDQKALLAAVSHEIRTPLGHMRLLLEMAKERGLGSEGIDELEAEVLEVDDLVGELLAHSRLEFEATDRRPLDAVDLARRALERAGLPTTLLHAEPGPLIVLGDATLIARALANLLRNAVQHGGGPTRLSVRREGPMVAIAVEDAGPGFPPEALESAFEPFRGAAGPSSADGRGGLGLGLALVRRVARAQGGDAGAENRDCGGSRVTLRLPTA